MTVREFIVKLIESIFSFLAVVGILNIGAWIGDNMGKQQGFISGIKAANNITEEITRQGVHKETKNPR